MVPQAVALRIAWLLFRASRASRPFPENPILDLGPGNDTADPCILEYNETLYLYPTGDQTGYQVYTLNLADLNDTSKWTPGPVVFSKDEFCGMALFPGMGRSWSLNWAPHVSYDPDSKKFYLYYSVCFNVGVAVSDSPLGPFEDHGVLVGWAIDAFVMRDVSQETGRVDWYLYYAGVHMRHYFNGISRIWGQRLKPGDMTKLDDTPGFDQPKLLLRPSQDWEWSASIESPKGVVEAPWVMKLHPGDNEVNAQPVYYLMYSGAGANTPAYSLGYATSNSPLGPFTRYENNPIITPRDPSTLGILGPGHHAVWTDKAGRMWVFYHQQRSTRTGWDRTLMVDELKMNGGVMSLEVTKNQDSTNTAGFKSSGGDEM